MCGHGDDGVWVTGEDAGAGDTVEGFFGRLIAFGVMAAEDDGGVDLDAEGFDIIHEVGHIMGGIFVSRAQQFIERVEEEGGEAFLRSGLGNFGQEDTGVGGISAEVPEDEVFGDR